ncbi:CBL-interacting serine/threonine-protein kinase 7 [Rhizoclosmatium hyalinum]|nr:CBL-interacting serine/threonine-protein kinase 7 [Rhizoclosmatium hyalinum]
MDSISAKFSLGLELGSGSTSTVHCVTNRVTGELLAVKIPKSRSTEVKSAFKREVEVLRKLKSQRGIVALSEVIQGDDQIYIVMELFGRGSLNAFVLQHGALAEHLVKRMGKELASILTVSMS